MIPLKINFRNKFIYVVRYNQSKKTRYIEEHKILSHNLNANYKLPTAIIHGKDFTEFELSLTTLQNSTFKTRQEARDYIKLKK